MCLSKRQVLRNLSALPNNQTSSKTHTGPGWKGSKCSYSGGQSAMKWRKILVRSQLWMRGVATLWCVQGHSFVTKTTGPEFKYTVASSHGLIFINIHYRRWLYIINILHWKKHSGRSQCVVNSLIDRVKNEDRSYLQD